MRIRWPRGSKDPRQRLFPSKPGVLFDVAIEDAGSSILVVPSWDGFRLAVAGRFYYWSEAQDVDVAPPADVDTVSQFLVRIPFKGFGRSQYLQHRDYDSAPAQPEAETLAPYLTRIPFRSFGRNPYLQHRDYDSAPVIAQESTLAPYLTRIPFKALGRNPYLWNPSQDLSFVEPLDLPYVIRSLQYKAFGRNPYVRHSAQDDSVPQVPVDSTYARFFVPVPFTQFKRRPQLGWNSSIEGTVQLNDTGSSILVVPSFELWRMARAGRFIYWTPPQDFSTAPIIETDIWTPFIVRLDLTSRLRGAIPAQIFLSHSTAQDENEPTPGAFIQTFIPTFRTRRGR